VCEKLARLVNRLSVRRGAPEIPADAPEGGCARCLLQAGLGLAPDTSTVVDPSLEEALARDEATASERGATSTGVCAGSQPAIPGTNASCERLLDDAGNVIETHEHKGDFREW